MIKSIVMMDLPIDDIAEMERWLLPKSLLSDIAPVRAVVAASPELRRAERPCRCSSLRLLQLAGDETHWPNSRPQGRKGAYCFTRHRSGILSPPARCRPNPPRTFLAGIASPPGGPASAGT